MKIVESAISRVRIPPPLPNLDGRLSQQAEEVDLRTRAAGARISSILIVQQKSTK